MVRQIKQCTKCNRLKPLISFGKCKASKDGLQYWCKGCRNADGKRRIKENPERNNFYVKKYYAKKRALLIKYKESLKCQQCGENHSACLDFHHRNPDEKEFNIAHSTGGCSIETIMNEIVKCDVLCANCHRKLHYSLKKELEETGR